LNVDVDLAELRTSLAGPVLTPAIPNTTLRESASTLSSIADRR
jgi:hypothetical protein